ncbi:MAG: LamG domain-containing protein, partial [Nanoarchaeota archaeon]
MNRKREKDCKRKKLNINKSNLHAAVNSRNISGRTSLEKRLSWVQKELAGIGPINKTRNPARDEKPPLWKKSPSEIPLYSHKPYYHTAGIKLFIALLLVAAICSVFMGSISLEKIAGDIADVTTDVTEPMAEFFESLFSKAGAVTGANVITLPAVEETSTTSATSTAAAKEKIEPDKNKQLTLTGSPLVSTGATSAGNTYYSIRTNSSATYNSYNCDTKAPSNSSGTGDDGMHNTTLGFPFPYFNLVKPAAETIYMDTNGRLSWNDATSDFSPSDLEMMAEQNIAALWQDLGGTPYNNEYICTNQGTAPNRYAVFRWDSAYYDNAGTVQAEAILFENGTIHFRYGSVADHTDADPTIIGVSLGDNANYNFTSNLTVTGGVLTNNSAFIYSRNLQSAISSLILNSTNISSNSTNENLTAYTSTSDGNNDNVKVIYNWYRNKTAIAVVNMPFEGVDNTASNNSWDYSGAGNKATEVGSIVWNYSGGHDRLGAYEFDGTDANYLSIPSAASLNLTAAGAFAIALWIKPADVSGWQYILGSTYNGATFRMPPAFALNGGDLSIRWTVNDAGGQRALAASSVDAGKWSHIATTYNGTHVKLFVNGSLIDTQAASAPDSTSQALTIGRRGDVPYDTGLVFNGTIDDLFIFNISLSDKQIQALYENKTSIIVSDETKKDQIWQAAATANDGWQDSSTNLSDNITIGNVKPALDSLILNTTDISRNDTAQNLTAYWSISDVDSDPVKNITNWYLNGTSLTVLNMPFEKVSDATINATKDYSRYNNTGSEQGGITWNATGGKDGKGAFQFDGVNDYIEFGTTPSFNKMEYNNFSVSLWIKLNSNS